MRACLVEREISNIEKNEGKLDATEYCSPCAFLDAEVDIGTSQIDSVLWEFYDDLAHAIDDNDAKRIVTECGDLIRSKLKGVN